MIIPPYDDKVQHGVRHGIAALSPHQRFVRKFLVLPICCYCTCCYQPQLLLVKGEFLCRASDVAWIVITIDRGGGST